MSFFNRILQFLFPDACVGCRARGALVCDDCMRKLPPASSAEHSFVTSIFSYKDFRVRALVRLLKYKNTRHAADIFAPPLAAALTEFLGEEGLLLGNRAVFLVPIPLSKKRQKMRGYNQAELIARSALSLMPKRENHIFVTTKLLEKIIDTAPQAKIPKKSERLKNVGECFRVRAECYSADAVVILIDDVTTTGATLIAARLALKRAGFHTVFALTIAH